MFRLYTILVSCFSFGWILLRSVFKGLVGRFSDLDLVSGTRLVFLRIGMLSLDLVWAFQDEDSSTGSGFRDFSFSQDSDSGLRFKGFPGSGFRGLRVKV